MNSFSPADIKTSCKYNVNEVRAVTTKHTYSFRMADGRNLSFETYIEKIEPAMKAAKEETDKKLKEHIENIVQANIV